MTNGITSILLNILVDDPVRLGAYVTQSYFTFAAYVNGSARIHILELVHVFEVIAMLVARMNFIWFHDMGSEISSKS